MELTAIRLALVLDAIFLVMGHNVAPNVMEKIAIALVLVINVIAFVLMTTVQLPVSA